MFRPDALIVNPVIPVITIENQQTLVPGAARALLFLAGGGLRVVGDHAGGAGEHDQQRRLDVIRVRDGRGRADMLIVGAV